jgi:flagellar biosynthesis/type III secretory pathway chaperone
MDNRRPDAAPSSAEARIRVLEAQLLEASALLGEPIGHGVGLLCVAEAVRVILAQLAEANARAGKAETREAKMFAILEGAGYNDLDELNDTLTRDIEDCRRVGETIGDIVEQHIQYAAKADARLEQFARDIAHKLDILYEPPVAQGKCKYLAGIENLKERETALRNALTTVRDWPFDVRGDCVADARKLADAALSPERQEGEERE